MISLASMVDDNQEREFMCKLYQSNERLMYSIALRYTSNQYDCEDVVQDTVEKLCKKVQKLQSLPSYALQAYIVYTVRNTAINFQKHQAVLIKHTGAFQEDTLPLSDTPDILIEKIDDLKEIHARLSKVWDRLSDHDKMLLYNKYVFEQTTEELAKSFQCSNACIRMRLSRAKRKAVALLVEDREYDQT